MTVLLLAGTVVAQEPDRKPAPKDSYVGSSEYRRYCATCHGPSGRGDGVLADRLRFRPPDLTLLARRDGGKWDGDTVARIIDGRDPVKGHGGADMPVWGDAFKSSGEGYDDEAVKTRIQAIVGYLESLQETGGKPEK